MLARRHPGSFPQANLPILYNVVNRCKDTCAQLTPNTCYAYPIYGTESPPAYQTNPSNPTNNPKDSTLLYYNDKVFVVNDPYPKSRFHCLVMPWNKNKKSLNDLRQEDVPLLYEMEAAGKNYIAYLREKHMDSKKLRMILGFHAIPSLPMLHMHCISLDLESDKLKKKQHYNSFATYYFLPFEAVVEDLIKNDMITINQNVDALNALADGPMKCLWCGEGLSNMPEMKKHVPKCPQNLSRE